MFVFVGKMIALSRKEKQGGWPGCEHVLAVKNSLDKKDFFSWRKQSDLENDP